MSQRHTECRCRETTHDLYCPQVPPPVTMGEMQKLIVKAITEHGMHESRPLAIARPDGLHDAVGIVAVAFVRGEFALVIHPR